MKKRYSKPVTEVINVETTGILCQSGNRGYREYDDEMSHVPGLNIPDGNMPA